MSRTDPPIAFHPPKTGFSAKKRVDSAWALGRIASCLNALHLSAPPVVSNLSHLLHFNLIVSSLIGNTNPVAHMPSRFLVDQAGLFVLCCTADVGGVGGPVGPRGFFLKATGSMVMVGNPTNVFSSVFS